MSTTYIIEPEPDDDADLADFMSSLDAEFGAKSGKAKAKTRAAAPAPLVIQQWFPHRTLLVTTTQRCKCGEGFGAMTDGIFLENIHRNGAIQRLRHSGTIPQEYIYLPRAQIVEETSSEVCIYCFDMTPPERPDATVTLVRSLPPETKEEQ